MPRLISRSSGNSNSFPVLSACIRILRPTSLRETHDMCQCKFIAKNVKWFHCKINSDANEMLFVGIVHEKFQKPRSACPHLDNAAINRARLPRCPFAVFIFATSHFMLKTGIWSLHFIISLRYKFLHLLFKQLQEPNILLFTGERRFTTRLYILPAGKPRSCFTNTLHV